MKRSMRATVARTVRRAHTWRPKLAGSADLDIQQLISPLRYDVLVRAEFFAFLAERPASEPEGRLVAAARAEPYHVWFRHVAMARFRPWTLQGDRVFDEQFAERVLTARTLWRSFQASGFDPRSRVTLRAGLGATVTDSGIVIDRPFHVGDGGHRLALLLASGGCLAAGQYRVDPRPAPVIDNTAVLVPLLHISEAEYARFLSAGYLQEECSDLQGLCEHLADVAPARVREIRALAKAHGWAIPVRP